MTWFMKRYPILHIFILALFTWSVMMLISSIALAADAATAAVTAPAAASPQGFPWWIELTAAFGSALIAGLAWLGKKLFDYLATQTQNQFAAGVISRIDDFALGVISDFYVLVKQAKDRGEWNATAAEELKAAAIARLKSYLGTHGIDALAKLLGSDGELEKFLGDRVELAIARSKNAGKLARSGAAGAAAETPAASKAALLASVDP